MPENIQLYLTITILLLTLIVALLQTSKKKKSAYHKIKVALEPYRQEEVKNIILPDGVGGLVEIEHMVLLEQGLLIIETYPISGNIFGAENIDQWTQLVNGRSFKFTNPLYRVQMLRQAIKVIAPTIPIYYRVIFSEKDSNFPKGKPEEVSTLATLQDDLMHLEQLAKLTEKQRSDWKRLLRIARKEGKAVLKGIKNG